MRSSFLFSRPRYSTISQPRSEPSPVGSRSAALQMLSQPERVVFSSRSRLFASGSVTSLPPDTLRRISRSQRKSSAFHGRCSSSQLLYLSVSGAGTIAEGSFNSSRWPRAWTMTYSVPANVPLIPPSAAAKLRAAEGFSVRIPTFPMTMDPSLRCVRRVVGEGVAGGQSG